MLLHVGDGQFPYNLCLEAVIESVEDMQDGEDHLKKKRKQIQGHNHE